MADITLQNRLRTLGNDFQKYAKHLGYVSEDNKLLQEAADALDARDKEIKRLKKTLALEINKNERLGMVLIEQRNLKDS